MAYLIAKRIYQGEAVPILSSEMSVPRALIKLREIKAFDGAFTGYDEEDDGEGDLWFEIERSTGELVSDPICFPAALAHEILTKTGATNVDTLLSPEYAASRLRSIWQQAKGTDQ